MTTERRYQLLFAALAAALLFTPLAAWWMIEQGMIPSFSQPLSAWLGQEPSQEVPAPEPVKVVSKPKPQPEPQAQPEPKPKPARTQSMEVAQNSQPAPGHPTPPADKPEAGAQKTSHTKPGEADIKAGANTASSENGKADQAPQNKESKPSQPKDEQFPIEEHHFERAQEWISEGKSAPLLMASYYPDEIVRLARQERGFIVAEGRLNGKIEKMLVRLGQDDTPSFTKLDRRAAPNISSSAMQLRPTGDLAPVAEAAGLCFAGRPAQLFFHPTASVGSAIVRKQFAAIAAAGITEPSTVAVTDGKLVVEGPSIVYVVESLMLKNSRRIPIADRIGKQLATSMSY